jgi:phosphoribosylamine--glycine ligase
LNILVIGSGAREHALVWKIAQSPMADNIFVAPGNAGTAHIAQNLNIKPTDILALADAAGEKKIDLVVVGPEGPLSLGIVDYLEKRGIPTFGPSKAAAQLESSKAVSRTIMEKYGIPFAQGVTFDSYPAAAAYLEKQEPPVVIKADGLAAGKGVVVAGSKEEARQSLERIMVQKVHGAAGERVVIEECLAGREVSLLAFTDGKAVIPLVAACDYKRIYDGDHGPNTGGMGSYSPPGFFTYDMARTAVETVLVPAIKGMAGEGMPYKGVLYAGLMVTDSGLKTLEFNARFGDPETQAILPRLKSDILEVFMATVEGRLGSVRLEWSNDSCLGVVMASGGYPGTYKTGFLIEGLDTVDTDVVVFHAGTKSGEGSSKVYTDGGRVLTVTATGKDMAEARAKVYRNIERIKFEGSHYRTDIALREVK